MSADQLVDKAKVLVDCDIRSTSNYKGQGK
jgi:hypothetical protein